MKSYRRPALVLLIFLVLLTILSCLGYNPQGPFDARDYSRVAGIRLEQHSWVALIEPPVAPFMILSGSPDFLKSCISTLIWAVAGIAIWAVIAFFRFPKGKRSFTVLLKGLRTILAASATLALIVLLFVVARVPGWKLVVDDPDLIVADLHSHTTKSHDALATLKANLRWHASCGYNLVGLTEHDQLFSHESPAEDSSFDSLPAFISGVEAHAGMRSMLVGICRDDRVKFEKFDVSESPDRVAWFAKKIHDECGGAVISLTLKRFTAGDIPRFADDGIDAFEIENSGHPEMRPDLRRELLDTCRSRGIPLVANTDWHGWTGLARTWTVISAPGASALSHSQKADLVIRKLREHDSSAFIPIIAGRMGDPSPARMIFSPIIETVRYAMELSTARIVSWWIWVWSVFVLWVVLRRRGVSPEGVLLSALSCAAGIGLIIAGISLVGEGTGDGAAYPVHIGLISMAIGVIPLGILPFSIREIYRVQIGHDSDPFMPPAAHGPPISRDASA